MPEEPIHFSPDSLFKGELKKTPKFIKFLIVGGVFAVTLVLIFFGLYSYALHLNQPAEDFPVGKPITIEQGTEVRAITEILERENVVRSSTLLYYVSVLFYEPKDIKASSYVFERPITTFEVAERLTQGDFDTGLIRFTHFEGERVSILAERASEVLPNFDVENFAYKTETLEGKLFPDTYFIPSNYTEEELLTLMTNTFEQKISGLEPLMENSNLTLDEIIILASIIEREANSPESKKMVSGILQNRLESGMPLQADATMEYVLDKPLSELTPEDLKIESSYNTYLYKGLPPTPIGNPGLESIMAVLEPTKSEYFYYITGNDGEFYYAKTYNDHLRNIEKYLR